MLLVLLLAGCGAAGDPTTVVSGEPVAASPPTSAGSERDAVLGLSAVDAEAFAEVVEAWQFERAVRYATAVEEARAAQEAQEAAERAAEEQRRREAAATQQAAPSAPSGSVWYRLAECESHGDWGYNPNTATWGSRIFEGGLQFHPSTWDGYRPAGYPAAAYLATPAQQIAVAERVLAEQGWRAWPACSRKLGLR